MIRVAFLEYEKETKDIAFALSKIFYDEDWTFRHFYKASDLARHIKKEQFSLFVFDEIFKTPRLESVFVHDNPNAIFIYVCSNVDKIKRQDQRARILYISKDNIEKEMERCSDIIRWQCAQSDLYNLVYDGVNVNLPYDDIYYMEKIEKLVYFHTKKGVFHKRTNMSDLEEEFSAYGFIRTHVSYLVNEKHIVAWFKDEVDLDTGKRVPLSRAQKRKILSRKKENMQTVPD